ncbi:MAG: hypothetical protein ACRDWT_08975 [Jatrophihabitantaceae bacterium]
MDTAKLLEPAVRAVVDTHLDYGPPVLIEGDFVLPCRVRDACVRVLVLDEPDRSQLEANFARREPGAGPQTQRATVAWIFGQWLSAEAASNDVPVISARPWDTALARVVVAG